MVKIIECPRDAWQGLPKVMPPEVKAQYLRALIEAGFTSIDAVSFVSEKAVPQMADSELVLDYLDPPDDVEIIGIVVNGKPHTQAEILRVFRKNVKVMEATLRWVSIHAPW